MTVLSRAALARSSNRPGDSATKRKRPSGSEVVLRSPPISVSDPAVIWMPASGAPDWSNTLPTIDPFCPPSARAGGASKGNAARRPMTSPPVRNAMFANIEELSPEFRVVTAKKAGEAISNAYMSRIKRCFQSLSN